MSETPTSFASRRLFVWCYQGQRSRGRSQMLLHDSGGGEGYRQGLYRRQFQQDKFKTQNIDSQFKETRLFLTLPAKMGEIKQSNEENEPAAASILLLI